MVTSSEYEKFIYCVCQALGEPDGIIVHRNKVYTGRLSKSVFNKVALGEHFLIPSGYETPQTVPN